MNAPGFWEIIFLAVLALLIFGPERLPKIAQSAGEMIGRLKREAAGTLDELKAAAELEEFSGVARELRATTADLRRDFAGAAAAGTAAAGTAAAGTAAAQAEKPHTAQMSPGPRTTPPPFDPDTP